MTETLPERPPGRVHWPHAKWDEACLQRMADGLPPWSPSPRKENISANFHLHKHSL
ncbi:hypothetical protein N9D63_07195 [Opitutales bacterium]|nr:hypothetical protein [Opitutales bacterium]